MGSKQGGKINPKTEKKNLMDGLRTDRMGTFLTLMRNTKYAHTLNEHFAVTDADLCDRAINDLLFPRRPGIERTDRKCASRFTDQAQLFRGLEDAITANIGRINKWLENQPEKESLTITSRPSKKAYGVGVHATETDMQFRAGYVTTLVLVRDENAFGFGIKTGFPDIDKDYAIDPQRTKQLPALVAKTPVYKSADPRTKSKIAAMSGISKPGRTPPNLQRNEKRYSMEMTMP